MKNHTKVYLKAMGLSPVEFIPCEVCGNRAVDIHQEPEFKEAVNGGMYKYVLWKLDQELRGKIKYEQLNDCEHKCYSDIREQLHQILSQNNLDIE